MAGGREESMATTHLLSPRLEQLMASMNLKPSELAGTLGASERTVARWLAGETYPQHDSREALERLIQLEHRLNETFSSHPAARVWLHAESGYFGGLAPMDALLRGRIEAVNAALDALDAGVFV